MELWPSELRSFSAVELIQLLDNLPEDIRTTVRNNGGDFDHIL